MRAFVFIRRPSLTYLHSSRHKMALRRVIVTDTWPRAAFGLTLTSHVYRDSGPPSENAICIIYPIHHRHRAARNFGVFCVLLQQQMECRSPTMLRKPTHSNTPPPVRRTAAVHVLSAQPAPSCLRALLFISICQLAFQSGRIDVCGSSVILRSSVASQALPDG